MKHPLLSLVVTSSLIALGTAFVVPGCGVADNAFGECKPDPLFPVSTCPGDAGTDGDGGGGDPGFGPQGCTGECVPIPSDSDPTKSEAGFWSQQPLQVWFGPKEDLPKDCPEGSATQFVLYKDLVAPPAICDTCECDLKPGKCEGVPGSISLRAGMCLDANVSEIPFDGPPGWDGSCTAANASPSGAECPAGSGILCAQSISYSALPPPAGESCSVHIEPIPKLTILTHDWQIAARACLSSTDAYRCQASNPEEPSVDQWCAPKVLMPQRQCIWRAGKHDRCPENYAYEGPVHMYPYEPKEGRGCTECKCGGPEGGVCIGRIRLFSDNKCTSQFSETTISSEVGDCDPIAPVGSAVGSKSLTDRMYMPGSCAPSGGEPFGQASPDDTGAVTFCCLKSYVFEE